MTDAKTDPEAPSADDAAAQAAAPVAPPAPGDPTADPAGEPRATTGDVGDPLGARGDTRETDGPPSVAEGHGDDEALREGRARRAFNAFLDMPVEGWVTLFVVAFCVGFVFWQLDPFKILSDTTPAGGDMGAHVWAPAYLRDHLLTKGRFTGWTPDWYAGFPAFHFYMIIPSLAIALLSFVIPYGIAFKLVAVSGCVSLPFSAYFFGRMARLPFPAPPLLAVAATFFLFDRSFSIYGGNIPSTLAGEFAFSISLSLALLYLGVLARGLETGRHRGWCAALLALTGLCHLIPFIFVLVCTGLWLVLRPGLGQLKYLLTVGPVAAALTLFWMGPFYLRSGYMNDMGWEKIERYRDYLWDRGNLDPQLINVPDLKWVIAFAAVGLLLSLVYRRRAGVFLAMTAAAFAIGFVYAPQGRLWNARLLPFYYLALYLLAAVGIAELGRLLSALFARDVNRPIRAIAIATPLVGWAIVIVMLSMSLQVMPGGKLDVNGTYKWGPFSTTDRSFVDSWADWNFDGYEGSTTNAQGQTQYKKSYPEYYEIVTTMKDLGQTRGCGRAMWEHEEQHDRYGTPMALMLLPFWTDGCIGSMEGLYFEASTTTPYHFLNQDELSHGPSNAQRDLPYGPGAPTPEEFDIGVDHMQMMGVKYYMAINDATKALAQKNPELAPLTSSGPWTVYEVKDSALIEPLRYQPAVLTGQETTGREWQDTSVCWYESKTNWDVFLTDSGPADWQTVEQTVDHDEKASPATKCEPDASYGWLTDGGGPQLKAQKPITVSNVVTSDDSISFDVSEPGVPVLVKASYFPNWQVSGADGPYRSTPNFMIVVPTSNHVELHYGWTGIDILSNLLTLLGIAGLVFLFKAGDVTMRPPRRFWGKAERPDLYPAITPDLRFEHGSFEEDQAMALAMIIPDELTGPDADALGRRTASDAFGSPIESAMPWETPLPAHPPEAFAPPERDDPADTVVPPEPVASSEPAPPDEPAPGPASRLDPQPDPQPDPEPDPPSGPSSPEES